MTVPSITPAPIDATASSVRNTTAALAEARAAWDAAAEDYETARLALVDAQNAYAKAQNGHRDALAAWDALGRSLEPEEVTSTP